MTPYSNAKNVLSPCIRPFLCIVLRWTVTCSNFFVSWSSFYFMKKWKGSFFEKNSPKPWISLSTWPFWSTLSKSLSGPQELCHFLYHRSPFRCHQLLSLHCPAFVTMAPVSPWEMVPSNPFTGTSSNRLHVWLSQNLPQTHSARKDKPLWLLPHSLMVTDNTNLSNLIVSFWIFPLLHN